MDLNRRFLIFFIGLIGFLASSSLIFSGNILRESYSPDDKIIGAFFYIFSSLYVIHPFLFYFIRKIENFYLFMTAILVSIFFSLTIIYFCIEIYNAQLQ